MEINTGGRIGGVQSEEGKLNVDKMEKDVSRFVKVTEKPDLVNVGNDDVMIRVEEMEGRIFDPGIYVSMDEKKESEESDGEESYMSSDDEFSRDNSGGESKEAEYESRVQEPSHEVSSNNGGVGKITEEERGEEPKMCAANSFESKRDVMIADTKIDLSNFKGEKDGNLESVHKISLVEKSSDNSSIESDNNSKSPTGMSPVLGCEGPIDAKDMDLEKESEQGELGSEGPEAQTQVIEGMSAKLKVLLSRETSIKEKLKIIEQEERECRDDTHVGLGV
ncbi:hypothetical protein L2E82_08590 [Cichorium intybus]|uniref:Uncharacterized protein n=1 Tax=Cichorium intybus TaxID=13427 RepID=A0ACB9G8L2_CICIN|nr:hypothetical protein L2E82_08590 [Cichorium intybus]